MLSEINLLPQKERRSVLFVIVLTIILAVGVIGGTLLSFHYQSLARQKSMKEAEIATIAKEIEIATIQLQEASSKSNVLHYKSIVETVRQLPLRTVAILDDMAAVLPTSGHFYKYEYMDTGEIILTVQFNNLNDVAYYLHELTYADWVKDVEINLVNRVEGNGVSFYRANYNVELDKKAFLLWEGDGVD
ncbi:PilN domain-containing protein [Paenibacillus lentus]|uniref:PilN domain-containing protein n=1 Tax=Paenibacillus lentus TaxID=1338368 RepID=UPI00366277B5